LAEGARLPRGVWIAIAIDVLVLSLLGADRYLTYHSGMDLGLFVQAVAAAPHGFANQPEHGSHYLRHFSPILWLAVPALVVFQTPIALIVVQAVAGALVAPPTFLIARRRLDERLSTLVAIVALLYPPLVGVAFTDFHENGFAPAIVAWLLWAVDARRFWWASLFALLALCVKEDEALVLLVLGAGYAIYAALRKDRAAATFGAVTALAAAFVFFGYLAFTRAWAGANLAYYSQGWPTDARGLSGVWFRLSFLLEAFVPLLFIPLRSPVVILALPGFVEALASRWSITYTMGQHYPGIWIGYVLVAFALGVASIAARDAARARSLTIACTVVCSLVLVFASPTHWAHFLDWPGPRERALDRVLARIPPDASVCAVDEVFTHLSLDPAARPGYEGACAYMVLDAAYDSPTWRGTYSAQVKAKLATGAYAQIAQDDGVTLYQARGR